MSNDGRVERGRAIASSRGVREAFDGTWLVLSQSQKGTKYVVNPTKGTCTCPDFRDWELDCKHLHAVRFYLAKDTDPNVMQQQRPSYPQAWAAYNAAQINEKASFERLLKDLCDPIPTGKQVTGRPRLPLNDVIYAACLKVYTTFSGRRASTDIRECREKGLIDKAPHHNSISHYLRMPQLTPILKAMIEDSAAPLKAVESQFAVDSTGFATTSYHRWFDHKYGKDKKQVKWLKAHAMVGTKTNIVTSIEVTASNVGDAPMLPELLDSAGRHFKVREVSADKAYLSNRNLDAIDAVEAAAYIPFKSNNTSGSTTSWKKLWHMFWFRRDEFSDHYHRRSNVETTFSMVKRKFGSSLRSKETQAQTNELLCKFLVHNIVVLVHEMHELGIDPQLGLVAS